MKNHDEVARGTLKTYVIGFVLSLLLTLAAYFPVLRHVHSGHTVFTDRSLVVAIITLALIQLFVQLIFFLHLGRESKPRWNLVMFLFAAMVVLILVLGSLWIMWNLNYHMAAPQTDSQLIHDEGVQP